MFKILNLVWKELFRKRKAEVLTPEARREGIEVLEKQITLLQNTGQTLLDTNATILQKFQEGKQAFVYLPPIIQAARYLQRNRTAATVVDVGELTNPCPLCESGEGHFNFQHADPKLQHPEITVCLRCSGYITCPMCRQPVTSVIFRQNPTDEGKQYQLVYEENILKQIRPL